MTIQDIKKDEQKALDILFDECRLFWAFSNEQLTKGLERINHQQGEKLTSIGAGGYLPKSNVDKFVNGMKQIKKDFKAKVKAHKLRPQVIADALINYECYYTGDIEDALEALGKGYNRDEVQAVYDANKAEYWEKRG